VFSLLKPTNKTNTTAQANHSSRRVIGPHVDIHETTEAVLVIADMPGVEANGVEVQVHGDVLTLRGTSQATEPERFQAIWREYAISDYQRTFRLGHAIDTERITASAKDGVIRVTLPKRVTAQPKRIPVTAN